MDSIFCLCEDPHELAEVVWVPAGALDEHMASSPDGFFSCHLEPFSGVRARGRRGDAGVGQHEACVFWVVRLVRVGDEVGGLERGEVVDDLARQDRLACTGLANGEHGDGCFSTGRVGGSRELCGEDLVGEDGGGLLVGEPIA